MAVRSVNRYGSVNESIDSPTADGGVGREILVLWGQEGSGDGKREDIGFLWS